MKPFTTIAIIVFLIVSMLHFIRYFNGWPVVIANTELAVWISLPVGIVLALLAFFLWRENKKDRSL